jgi:CubicO group peptidase (beta-lactamase class C family)
MQQMMRRLLIVVALFILPVIGQSSDLSVLDEFVPAQMKKWKVPGLAIAVVQHGKVIYIHGFGSRDLKQNLPVTTKTLFAIGSITKSFTSLSMGIANDDGRMDWDKPVRDYLPEFQMYDAVASERMTPRDLISHRTGWARHDLVWYASDFSREDLLHRLRYLQSNRDFRSGYNYNNLLVMTAGYLVGKVSGQDWETFVQQRIFQPLQMNSTNFSVTETQKNTDYAHPYIEVEEKVQETPFHALDSVCPAGCINSNVEDMARYAIFQLGKGKVGDQPIVSEANLQLMHTAQAPMGDSQEFKEIGPYSYGMGWVTTSYRGRRNIWHNGGIDGFYALLTMLPEEELAVVILTNRLGQPVPEMVAYKIYDQLLGLDAIDWGSRYDEMYSKAKAAAETTATNQKTGTQPSHPLKDYAGVYDNPGYGKISIAAAGDDFTMKLNAVDFSLKHFHYDVFEVPEKAGSPFGGFKIRFLTNMNGDIDSIAIPFESDAPEIIFTRMPVKASRETLLPLAGDYDLGNVTVSVAMKSDELQLTIPGQPAYTLEFLKDLKFAIKGLSGYSVEFRKDPTGKVNELVLFQPDGTFVAKRKTQVSPQ